MADIIGTNAGETLIGTADADLIVGMGGADTLSGLGGDDQLFGSQAGDTLDGGAGVDFVSGDQGDDMLIGGLDGDMLVGDGGTDTVSYASAPSVTVDLETGVASATDGTGGTDFLGGIENVTGSAFNDTLIGDGGVNVLDGGAGNDTLTGGLEADVFNYSFSLIQGGGVVQETLTDFIGQGGDALTDSTYTQSFFSSQYTAWLRHVVDTYNLGSDVDGDGIVEVGLNQNDATADATPYIEGMSDGELAAIFTDRDSVVINTGKVTQDRYYSNSFSTDDGQNAVTSADGFDTIVDFVWGVDKLAFDGLAGLTLEQFTSSFTANQVDANGDGTMDTVLALADGTWSATLLGVSGHTEADFYNTSIFS